MTRSRLLLTRLAYGIGCGLTTRFDPPTNILLDDFLGELRAPPLGPDCIVFTSYVGPARDSEGNVLTQPSLSSGIQCNSEINGVTFRIPDHMPIRCQDSAGHECSIQGDMAVFPFVLAPFENWTFNLETNPPLERGDRVQLLIDTDRGNARVEDVM
jgi:hypothetical protein